MASSCCGWADFGQWPARWEASKLVPLRHFLFCYRWPIWCSQVLAIATIFNCTSWVVTAVSWRWKCSLNWKWSPYTTNHIRTGLGWDWTGPKIGATVTISASKNQKLASCIELRVPVYFQYKPRGLYILYHLLCLGHFYTYLIGIGKFQQFLESLCLNGAPLIFCMVSYQYQSYQCATRAITFAHICRTLTVLPVLGLELAWRAPHTNAFHSVC